MARLQTADQTVFLVDDDPGIRRAIGRLIQVTGRSVETFASATAFLERFEPGQTGCMVLDIKMPGMNGLELQQELKRRNAPFPIIFITAHADVPMAVQALRDSAFDFITKPFEHEELLNRIDQAFAKFARRSEHVVKRQEVTERSLELTAREREVMQLVVMGLANKVMANRLGVSRRTVEVHRARVMQKMGAESLAELVRMSILLDESDDEEEADEN